MCDKQHLYPSLDQLQECTAQLSDAALLAPINHKWTILQHLYHCWMVERGVLAYIKLKTQDPSALVAVQFKTRLKFYLFFVLLRLGWLRVQAPQVVQEFPEEMNREDLFERWKNTRDEWRLFLANVPAEIASKGIFKHVFIGRLNKRLAISFLTQHLTHHLRLCALKTN